MKHWKPVLIPAMAFSLLSTPTLWAAEEEMEEVTPTFQNAAQLERALNLTSSSFTEDDMQDAKDQAEDEATKQIDALAKDHADSVVDQISSDHADIVVEEKSSDHADSIVEEQSSDHADRIVHETSLAYATEQAEASRYRPGSDGYNAVKRVAYNDAKARATAEGDWENLWETTYNDAKARATAEGDWENAWETAYNYAIERATNEDYSNAYQAAYKKALEVEVANITGKTLQDIYEMRYVEKLGWGVITKKRLRLHPSHNGLGNKWKHNTPPSINDVEIPSGPMNDVELPLEEEIAKATERNIRTGWIDDPELQAMDNTKKGKKKKYALTQTSGLASEDVRGNSKGINGNAKDKSSVGNSGKISSAVDSQAATSNKSKNNNGNKSANGNKGGNGNKSDNGNKGGNGNKSDNGNKGGNGKGKK